jgi:hypothetical protein
MPRRLRSTDLAWARLACRLAKGFLARFVFVRRALALGPRPDQLLMPAAKTFPGEKAEHWSQLHAQETFPPNAVHSMALTLLAHHVRSLRGREKAEFNELYTGLRKGTKGR